MTDWNKKERLLKMAVEKEERERGKANYQKWAAGHKVPKGTYKGKGWKGTYDVCNLRGW